MKENISLLENSLIHLVGHTLEYSLFKCTSISHSVYFSKSSISTLYPSNPGTIYQRFNNYQVVPDSLLTLFSVTTHTVVVICINAAHYLLNRLKLSNTDIISHHPSNITIVSIHVLTHVQHL